MPKLFPAPFGVAVRVPLVPETVAFHEFCRVCPPCVWMETRHVELPDTASETLNRSDHSEDRVTETVQPPGCGLVPPPFRALSVEV